MDKSSIKKLTKKTWNFIWHDDSFASWIVNIILAIVLVKFLIYPGIGLILDTKYPLVAVVSSSMEHHPGNFDKWWNENRGWYEDNGISKEEFDGYRFKNGFDKGDIMILTGRSTISKGDILVYQSNQYSNPIIHRVVGVNQNSEIIYKTKGDNNLRPDPKEVKEEQTLKTGEAIVRIPLLGWIKIIATDIVSLLFRRG